MNHISANFPIFLQSYVDFMQHIEGLYKDFNSPKKGAKFAELAKNILSTHEELLRLKPELNPKQSHDQGVDIFWIDPETKKQKVYCQSKFHIRDKDDLDSIIGKFASFEYQLENLNNQNKPKVYQPTIFDIINNELISSE